MSRRNPAHLRRTAVLLLLAACVTSVACPATRGRRGIPETSGFLGDYSQLAPNPDFPAAEVYINPRAIWSQYDSVHIDSVTLWRSGDVEKNTPEERQMLADLFYTALHQELSKSFRIVEEPTASTVRLRAAVSEAKGAHVATRTISTLIPQALVMGTAVGLSADTANTVGTATIEAELLDGVTAERLAAVVDDRAGTKSLLTKRTFSKWGDVKAAAEYWAREAAKRLAGFGVQLKPGGAVPE